MKKTILTLIFVTGTLSAWGYTRTSLELLGFSEDGAYLAFQISGYEDGSGEGFSLIRIVDTAANEFVTEDIADRGTESGARMNAGTLARAWWRCRNRSL